MKLLILGNGFDKMHGLPTSYTDFLDFIKFVREAVKKTSYNLPEYAFERAKDNIKYMIKDSKKYRIEITDAEYLMLEVDSKELEDFYNNIKKSFWITYFEESREKLGYNWMNFEEEIERVVKEVFDANYKEGIILYSNISNEFVSDYFGKINGNKEYSKEFEKKFNSEFCILISLIDKYMSFINNLKVKKLELFNTDPALFDKVLTFNYTNTYEKVYGKHACDICHIHGEVGKGIVLGFDDHYFEDNNVIPQHIMYEKYYQRIVNKTDITYNEWVEQAKTDKVVIVDIIGHSLSPADGDILSKIIMIENAQINIVYRNDEDRAEKIKNLAIILKPEKLIEYTNSLKPKISFIRIDTPEPLDFSNIIMA